MEEIQVKSTSGSITTNFDVIEAQLKEYLANYDGIVVTEDSIKESKKDIAELRKVKASLDDARKNTKKQWLAPYEEFEAKCKSLIALVDAPINLINEQLKLFEEDRIAAKREHVKEIYATNIGELERFLPFEKIYNPKWDNVSYSDKDIVYDLQEMILRVKNDLIAIHALNSEIEQECVDTYERFGNDLSMAISKNTQFVTDKARVEEKVKAEIKTENLVEKTLEPVKTTRMVHFIVANEDADTVRQLLINAGIIFGEE